MVTSALRHITFSKGMVFTNLKISLKSSDVLQTIRAYQGLAAQVRYPFHLGVTEAGTLISGTIKSALGLGLLLYQGIGDTLRVSLTAPPREEIRVALRNITDLKLRKRGMEIISCPTCGRCQINLIAPSESGGKGCPKNLHPPLKWPSWAVWSTGRGRPGRRISALPEEKARGMFICLRGKLDLERNH